MLPLVVGGVALVADQGYWWHPVAGLLAVLVATAAQ
jgi:hypothetical protein